MGMWKSRYSTTGKTLTQVIDDLTKLLTKEPDAPELCAKLKQKFCAPPTRKLSENFGIILGDIIPMPVFIKKH